jgi:ABC-2 type transport system permease protein
VQDATLTPVIDRSPRRRSGPAYVLRILGVSAAVDYKVKYTGSVLGYFWSIAKPLALFTMLYLVFGHIFRLNHVSNYYSTSLLIGIVCYFFFADATTLGMNSVVVKASLVGKLIFPRIIIPTSAVLSAAMTFGVNLVAVGVFVAAKGITPRLSWLLLVPLLLELFAFVLGVALILATVFVRLRDIGQLWELFTLLFLYASPIMYPVGYLPPWAREIVFLNPFTQIVQDIRAVILYPDVAGNKITVTDALGSGGRLAPIAVTLLILGAGYLLFKREEPWFAERA